ncbi:MAG: HEAT repeat domain-containing protein, partial [Sphingobacterium sp.]
MKKIFNTITALLFIQVAAYGQQPTSRTTATKIADVLAQQPAEEQSKFLLAMKELEGFTSEDVAGLLGRLQPQGGDNAAIEYATNSYAFYVMQPNRDGQRATYVQGLLSALDQVEDKDNKAYVLELLKFCAKDEAVDGVAAYLTDEYLVEKAARVLNAIASPAAASALNSALATVSSEAEATAIIAALGNLQTEDAEQKIIELLGQFEEDNFQLNGLTALSQIAGPNSDRLFLDRAKAVDYQYEKTNAASLAVDYAQHLLEKGQDAQASKFARKLYKQAGSAKASTIQAGALGILTQISPAKQKRQLIKLASSDDKVLRNVALGLLADEATAKDLAKLAGSLRKLDGEAQESVLHFLADQQDAVPTIEVIEGNYPRLQEEDARIAALNALTVLSKGNNTPFLIGLIPEASEGELQAIQTLLLSSQGDNTVQEINGALSGSDAKTQALLLGVLAQRRNAESASVVLPLTGSADQSVRAAAYNALPTVVNANDLEAVIGLLAAAEGDELKAVQRAAIFAI